MTNKACLASAQAPVLPKKEKREERRKGGREEGRKDLEVMQCSHVVGKVAQLANVRVQLKTVAFELNND
jgi:hypothetical protein